MDKALVQRWNEKVQPGDIVYHLGDIFWKDVKRAKEIRSQLNGTIRLLRGNHDSTADSMKSSFDWIKDYYELKIPDETYPEGDYIRHIILIHYAMGTWRGEHRGTFHLYAHSHGSYPNDPYKRSFDVGCMLHNYYPLSFEEVRDKMSAKLWKPPFGKDDEKD